MQVVVGDGVVSLAPAIRHVAFCLQMLLFLEPILERILERIFTKLTRRVSTGIKNL